MYHVQWWDSYCREDGKDCMKFYTDPSYFFELWYAQMQSDISKKRKEMKEKRGKRERVSFGFVLVV